MSQTHLPQPFGLSLSKPGRSLRAALRQAQGERVYLGYVANQANLFPKCRRRHRCGQSAWCALCHLRADAAPHAAGPAPWPGASMISRIAAAVASGSSTWGQWPACSSQTTSVRGESSSQRCTMCRPAPGPDRMPVVRAGRVAMQQYHGRPRALVPHEQAVDLPFEVAPGLGPSGQARTHASRHKSAPMPSTRPSCASTLTTWVACRRGSWRVNIASACTTRASTNAAEQAKR